MLTLSATGLSYVLPERVKTSETLGKAKDKIFQISLVQDVVQSIDARTQNVAQQVEGTVNAAPKHWRALQHRVDYYIPPTDEEKKDKSPAPSPSVMQVPGEAVGLVCKCVFRVKEMVSKSVVAAPSTVKSYATEKVEQVTNTDKFKNLSQSVSTVYETGVSKATDIKTDYVKPTLDFVSIQYTTTKEQITPYLTQATESKYYADLQKSYSQLVQRATPIYEKAHKFAIDTSQQWPFCVVISAISDAKVYLTKNVPLEWLFGQTRTAAA